VWLPPGYDDAANAQVRYPVLYLQDGQNIFDHAPPTPGEWHADETADRLIRAGDMRPIVIVGIPNSGTARAEEYVPVLWRQGFASVADEYLAWVTGVVKPLIERDTKTPDHVMLISTLGGIAAFGLAGFVAGPLIAALFLVLWEMFAEEYAEKLAVQPEPPA
jgi:predicted alpha/beta superfamily hydrolase